MAAHDALRTILPVAGMDPERARAVEITGGADPVLPTPRRCGARRHRARRIGPVAIA